MKTLNSFDQLGSAFKESVTEAHTPKIKKAKPINPIISDKPTIPFNNEEYLALLIKANEEENQFE